MTINEEISNLLFVLYIKNGAPTQFKPVFLRKLNEWMNACLTCSFFPNDNRCRNALRLTMQSNLAISFDAYVTRFNNPARRYYNGGFQPAQKPFRNAFYGYLPYGLFLYIFWFGFFVIYCICFCRNEFYCGLRSS